MNGFATRLDRHVAIHILGLSAVVALGLVAIYTFINFVSDIEDTGQGGFGVGQLAVYTLMLMPAVLYTLMPLIAMLGTLMGLGALATQGELTAMRAAGLSILRIGGSAMLAGLLLGLLSLVLGDFLAPAGTQKAEAYRSIARFGVASEVGGKPVWLRDGDSYFRVKRLIAEDHIADVEIFTLDAGQTLIRAMSVKEARYLNGAWQFSGVQSSDFSDAGVSRQQTAELQWQGGMSPEVLRLFVLKADALTAPGLWRLIQYLDANDLDAGEYRLSLWRKLIAPFTVAAMMLFAVPFVFGALRDAGAGQRLLMGILIGVGFHVVNEVCASLGLIYAWPPFLAASVPTAAITVLALYRLRTAG